MNRSPGHTIEPVAVAVTVVVHPSNEAEFARWADEIDLAVSQFAGRLGSVRLRDAQGVNQLVYPFDTADHLHARETSAARRELLEQGDRISNEQRRPAAVVRRLRRGEPSRVEDGDLAVLRDRGSRARPCAPTPRLAARAHLGDDLPGCGPQLGEAAAPVSRDRRLMLPAAARCCRRGR